MKRRKPSVDNPIPLEELTAKERRELADFERVLKSLRYVRQPKQKKPRAQDTTSNKGHKVWKSRAEEAQAAAAKYNRGGSVRTVSGGLPGLGKRR